jgi:hypothetical protein
VVTVTDGELTASTEVGVTVDGPPSITKISNQTTKEDTATATIPFTIGDSETAVSKLTLTKASSNTTLIPTANIVLGGSGANRNVKITPAANKNGSATITLTVTDGLKQTASTSFLVTVSSVNDAPTISKPANLVLAKGTNRTISFTVGDTETAASALTVTRASSNTTLLPTANLVLGGSGANRSLKITPVSTQVGTATVTLTVADANGGKTSSTFTVTVANPPSIAAIANQTTNEDTTTATIAVKLSDPDTATSKLTLSAASSNLTLVPENACTFGGSGANRTLKIKPAASQNGSAKITLTVSDGQLFSTQSFTLTVKPVNDAPTITKVPNQRTNKNTATTAIAFTIGDVDTALSKLTVTKTSSNITLIPTSSIVIGGTGANRTVKITPASNKTGSATITLTVSDGALTTSTSFTVTVNAPPTISAIANQTIAKNGASTALKFTIGDAETPSSQLKVTKTSSNVKLVPETAIALSGSTANRTVKITPLKNVTGSAKVTLTVSDGEATASTSFTVTVK